MRALTLILFFLISPTWAWADSTARIVGVPATYQRGDPALLVWRDEVGRQTLFLVRIRYVSGAKIGIDGPTAFPSEVTADQLSPKVETYLGFQEGDIVAFNGLVPRTRRIRYLFANGFAVFRRSDAPEPIDRYVFRERPVPRDGALQTLSRALAACGFLLTPAAK